MVVCGALNLAYLTFESLGRMVAGLILKEL